MQHRSSRPNPWRTRPDPQGGVEEATEHAGGVEEASALEAGRRDRGRCLRCDCAGGVEEEHVVAGQWCEGRGGDEFTNIARGMEEEEEAGGAGSEEVATAGAGGCGGEFASLFTSRAPRGTAGEGECGTGRGNGTVGVV